MDRTKIWLTMVVFFAVVVSGVFREGTSAVEGRWVTDSPDGVLIFKADGTGESIAGQQNYFQYRFESKDEELTMSWSESFAQDESRPKRYAVKFIGRDKMVLGPPNRNFDSWSVSYTRSEL